MFKLIVALFVVTNGVPSNQPSGQFKNNQQFETEKSCMEYFSTEQGALARAAIDEFLQSQQGRLAAKFACIKENDDKGKI